MRNSLRYCIEERLRLSSDYWKMDRYSLAFNSSLLWACTVFTYIHRICYISEALCWGLLPLFVLQSRIYWFPRIVQNTKKICVWLSHISHSCCCEIIMNPVMRQYPFYEIYADLGLIWQNNLHKPILLRPNKAVGLPCLCFNSDKFAPPFK